MMNTPVVSQKPSAKAQRTIRQWIEAGDLPAGERLPSEQDLARQLGVGRRTVRTALSHLQDAGLIESVNQRVRIVSPRAAAANPHSIMSHSVAVFSIYEGGETRTAAGGWEVFVERGVVDALQDAGWLSLTIHPRNLNRARVDALLRDPPAGIISRDNIGDLPHGTELMQTLGARDIPIVHYGFTSAPSAFDTVATDHEQGCYELTKWLLSQGKRRILRYWMRPQGDDLTPFWLQERDAGYERAVREAGAPLLPAVRTWGAPFDEEMQHARETFEKTARLTADCLTEWLTGDEPVDAIMAISDGLVFSAAEACSQSGVDPEHDITIVGYDNYWSDSPQRDYCSFKPAATVDKNNRELGAELVRLLTERLKGDLPSTPQHRVVPQQLIVVNT